MPGLVPTNGNHTANLALAHLVVVVIGLLAATFLTDTGHLDSSAYTVIVGVLVGLVGGGAALGHGAAIGASVPHQSDVVIAQQANPQAGGRRVYDPPAHGGHDAPTEPLPRQAP